MTAEDKKNKPFRRAFLGYSIQEVNAYKEQVQDRVGALSAENDALKRRLVDFKEELSSYREREMSLEATLRQTRQITEEVKQNAERESQVILAEAELQAEKILNQAHTRLAQIHDDISELKRQRAQFEVRLRSLIEAHMKILDVEGDRDRDLAELEDKIRILRTPSGKGGGQ
jgi:cell division initiation protein